MNKINRGTGAGGKNTNKNGKKFEQDVNILNYFSAANFTHRETDRSRSIRNKRSSQVLDVFSQKELIGFAGDQYSIYWVLDSYFESEISHKNIMSKNLNPDFYFLNTKTKTLKIFEKKTQNESGSADEKLQTASFKINQYKKLVTKKEYSVEFYYVLNSYFNNEIYNDLFEYLESVDVGVFIEGINLPEISNALKNDK